MHASPNQTKDQVCVRGTAISHRTQGAPALRVEGASFAVLYFTTTEMNSGAPTLAADYIEDDEDLDGSDEDIGLDANLDEEESGGAKKSGGGDQICFIEEVKK
jgi:hypothetical protein